MLMRLRWRTEKLVTQISVVFSRGLPNCWCLGQCSSQTSLHSAGPVTNHSKTTGVMEATLPLLALKSRTTVPTVSIFFKRALVKCNSDSYEDKMKKPGKKKLTSYKVKHILSISSRNFIPRYLFRRNENVCSQ